MALYPCRIGSAWLLVSACSLAQAQAQVPSNDPTAEALATAEPETLHPWQAALPRLSSEAYFTNLKDGDKIETPFVVKFGLSGGWGLAPIAKASKGKRGHHHLLVNRELPLNFTTALPFTDQYIHFGGGQMETVLTFPPGTYKLRMLLANQKHLPFFVYSKPATITVSKKNDTDPQTLVSRGISMMVPKGPLKAPFRVQFHASGLNVGLQAQDDAKSGHFALQVASTSDKGTANLDFPNGQTEVYLTPPPGGYKLTLTWVSNASAGDPLGRVAPALEDITVQ
jgi:hypothetical protein